MYKLLFTAYTEEAELNALITNDFKQIDSDFYLFDSSKVNVSEDKYEVWDTPHFAEMSFQSYDKEEEMEQYIINELTQTKLEAIFQSNDPKKEFQEIIKRTFELENA